MRTHNIYFRGDIREIFESFILELYNPWRFHHVILKGSEVDFIIEHNKIEPNSKTSYWYVEGGVCILLLSGYFEFYSF